MSQKTSSYLLRLLGFVVFYGAAWLLIFFLQIGMPTESSRWIFELSQIKTSLAKHISERKILIVSGSNALFGLQASIIEQETHIKTVNMAIHAGLGVEYILDQARQVAKPGDIIIMPLEYPFYQFDGVLPFEAVDYVLSRDPEYFYQASLREQLRYLAAFTPVELLARVRKLVKPDSKVLVGYQSSTIDEFGDETLNRDANLALKMRAKVDGFPPINYQIAGFDNKGTALIKDFSNWCKARDIKLFATFPSFIFFPNYKELQQREFYEGIAKFYQGIGVPVLGNAYDFMYDKNSFFDTYYHLKADAAKKRTYQLLDLLKSHEPGLVHRQ